MREATESKKSHRAPAAAVIVAHPDDEVLWAGGQILDHPDWDWFIVALCRASDDDRAPRFGRALRQLRACGAIADLQDGPEQAPLPSERVQQAILTCVPQRRFDHIFTHGPAGEYTRHRRHEEVCQAVVALWQAKKLTARWLWMFAYEDGERTYLPRPRGDAHTRERLSEPLWQEKYRLITQVYGFAADSWEARTTPREEAFCRFDSPGVAGRYIQQLESKT